MWLTSRKTKNITKSYHNFMLLYMVMVDVVSCLRLLEDSSELAIDPFNTSSESSGRCVSCSGTENETSLWPMINHLLSKTIQRREKESAQSVSTSNVSKWTSNIIHRFNDWNVTFGRLMKYQSLSTFWRYGGGLSTMLVSSTPWRHRHRGYYIKRVVLSDYINMQSFVLI